MRELKFRAYLKEEKKYVFPTMILVDFGIVTGIAYTDVDESTHEPIERRLIIEDVVLEQTTGLRDKNGKKIYEGDIVLIDIWDGNKRVPEIGHIAYDQSFAGFKWLSADGISGYCLYDMDYPIRKVIGDIHNNPELLER